MAAILKQTDMTW